MLRSKQERSRARRRNARMARRARKLGQTAFDYTMRQWLRKYEMLGR